MSCSYYTYDGGYYCMLKRETVNDDVYYRYCRDYNYDDCPILKYEKDKSSGCYLTSACVEAMGLPDNCHELTMLRAFRDGYLKSTEHGEEEIAHYYEVAPQIVTAIRKKGEEKNIFSELYQSLVLPCVQLIEAKENEKAHSLYRETALRLEKQYL